jgi:hypothetical protein
MEPGTEDGDDSNQILNKFLLRGKAIPIDHKEVDSRAPEAVRG